MSGPAVPLITDSALDLQHALTRALRGPTMVFAYDCHGLRLLKDCHAGGTYAFSPTTTRQLVVRIDDPDVGVANLPCSTAAPALGPRQVLDVAAVLGGRWTSSIAVTHADALTGECEDATHVARAVWVGAAATSVHAQPDSRGPGSLLTSAAPLRKGLRHCAQAEDTEEPAPGCDTPVRLVLQPVLPARLPAEWSRRNDAQEALGCTPCPEGLVFEQGVCAPPGGDGSAGCTRDAIGSCEGDAEATVRWFEQVCELGLDQACRQLGRIRGYPAASTGLNQACRAGSAISCAWAASAAIDRDEAQAVRLLDRACALGNAQACGELTSTLLDRSDQSTQARGRQAWRRACEGGQASLCWSLGLALDQQEPSGQTELGARQAWVLGCRHGSLNSCYAAAKRVAPETRGGPDAVSLLEASCPDAPLEHEIQAHWNGCLDLADMLERGEGVEAQPNRAATLYERVCDMKIRAGCQQAARMTEAGISATKDPTRALRYWGKACRLGDADACMRAGELAGSEADQWYEEGCHRHRHAPACERLRRR